TAIPGRSATFSVVTNDPSRTSYQWQLSVGGGAFTDIGGATSQTYTTPTLTVADNGNQYRAHITSTGNGSMADSNAATLTVYNLTGPTAPKILDRFDNLADVDNQGSAPTTVQTLSGDYSFAGTAGSGYLILTTAENSKFGTLVVDDVDGGTAVGGFTASFKAQLVGANPADGFSFSWGTGIGQTQVYGGLEAGLGNDLRVSFITYAGSGRSIRVNFRGAALANVAVPIELLQAPVDTFKEVLIRVTPATASTSATLDVAYDGTLVIQNLALPGLQGIAGGRFAIAARTGGANELHAYDDLAISTSLYVGPITLVNQPPAALTIVNDTSVTLSVESSNPPVSSYQWQRSAPGGGAFVDIPTATSATYTTPNLPLGDSGVRYQVVVTGSTNVVTSNPTTVTVVSPGLPASFERIIDFNDGLVPADAQVFGSAVVTGNAGVDDTGMLQLTTAVNGLQGAMALADQDAGAPVTGFVTKFLVRIGNGTDPPADGASFVWSPELITGGFGEGGTGTGLIISFDIYDNDDGNPNNAAGEAPAIEALWKGETLGNVRVPRALLESGSAFREIIVRVNPDGTLDVIFGTQVIYWHTPLPGFAPIANGNFGWGGRTGGLNAEQDIDSIQLTTFTANQPTLVLATVGNNIVITFDGVLESSGNLTNWTPMPAQTSPLTLPISGLSGHTFYRARK
ncbi:MAG: Legume-like lectin family protein, partial [Verrucomicrobiales bacterium]|nr:Legume-like lectin family protein [Verrucomicrobiales bacterium]